MLDLTKILIDGGLLSLLSALTLLGIARYNPRLLLGDYPAAIQEKAPPKTAREQRQSLIVGIPFLVLLLAVPLISTLTFKHQQAVTGLLPLFLHAFGVAFIFNLFDLLVLDWLLFCYLTPKFMVIPGTEGMAAYKDYGFHFRGALVGTVFSAVAGLVIAGIVFWL